MPAAGGSVATNTNATRIHFGDGSSARGASHFKHTYAMPGVYTVR